MIATLEQFVRRLVQDAAFREMARRNPHAAVAGFGLTGPERQGALQLCAQVTDLPSVASPNRLWV